MSDKPVFRRRLSALALASAFSVLAACSDDAEKQPPRPGDLDDSLLVRTISQGEIQGARARDFAQAWYGIPFAAAPVGELRWRAPRPAPSWSGQRDGTQKSLKCPQTLPLKKEITVEGDEDCLYLDVYAPRHATGRSNLPVMFWIHGGGNYAGSGTDFDMGRLADSQQVVVVSINYRLGPLGWFAHGAIRQTAETPLDRSPNFGTLDIIAALEWVRDNIGALGGDASNVTIFGESAGGINVASLLVSPQARGLFHKAIIQSGIFRSHSMSEAEFGPPAPDQRKGDAAREGVDVIARQKGVDLADLDDAELAGWLRSHSAEEIIAAFKSLRPEGLLLDSAGNIDVTNDGIVIPEIGVEAAIANPQYVAKTPLILGTNRDELNFLGFGHEEMIGRTLGVHFYRKNKELFDAHGAYLNGLWQAFAVDAPAIALTAKKLADVYAYRFDWDEQGRAFTTDLSSIVGAGHGVEQGFVLGGFDDEPNNPGGFYFNRRNREGREKLSDVMMSYWANFAYTGAPGRGRDNRLTEWTAWTNAADAPKRIIFDSEDDGGIRLDSAILTPEDAVARIHTDTRLESDAERCLVAREALTFFTIKYDLLQPAVDQYCHD